MARALRLGDQAACGVDGAGSAGEGHSHHFGQGYSRGGAVAGVIVIVDGRGGCGGCGGDGVGVGGVDDRLDCGGGVAEVGEEGGAD